jgi:hypothetical protein
MRVPMLAVGAAALVFPLAPTTPHTFTAAQTGLMSPLIAPNIGRNCDSSEVYEPTCNPTGNQVNMLADGRVLYWSGLEGWSGKWVWEWASSGINDKAAILDLRSGTPKFTFGLRPNTNPYGADGDNAYFFNGALANNDVKSNDGSLFCSAADFLADGRILSVGGQSEYQDPGVPGHPEYGVPELNGIRNARIFDPKTNTWSDAESMRYARWYPSMITEPDGNKLVVSGTHKLIKPIYTDHPTQSYTNVLQLERFNPKTGEWTTLPSSANKDLPLYARLHLLPDGRILFPAQGQQFNTGDFKVGAAGWNFWSAFNPKTNTWTDLGINYIGDLPLGFRGTGGSLMLPISAADSTVQFLAFGGEQGTWPGGEFGILPTTLTTVGIGNNSYSAKQAGALHSGRWYSDGVLLPTGKVLTLNGSLTSELHHPGLEVPNMSTEMWDPKTQQWTMTGAVAHGRDYHNTAMLLWDGRVLIGGHAPPPFMYTRGNDTLSKNYGFGKVYHDSTFQIFTPPELFYGKRPVITKVNPNVATNRIMTVNVDRPADISTVVMVHNPAYTHLFDTDQRSVKLEIVKRTAHAVQVKVPGPTYLPPGPYMLFANANSDKGEIPSVSRQVFVDAKLPATEVRSLEQRAAELTKVELRTPALKVPFTPDPADSSPAKQMPAKATGDAVLPVAPSPTVAGRRGRGHRLGRRAG